jgi:shikimate dehydrogenase
MKPIKLGLIGDNILTSSAPEFHRLAAQQHGITLTYDLLIPKTLGQTFEDTVTHARDTGFHALNITLPYKERAFELATIPSPKILPLGSVNTVIFNSAGLTGHNTDYTGFQKSYRAARSERPAGAVLLIGAGGVGRAIAFALSQLGASRLGIHDKDAAKSTRLAADINCLKPGLAQPVNIEAAVQFDAVVNGTQMGMYGYEGLPIEPQYFPNHCEWAFDAVYQPVETPFKNMAQRKGAQFISGFELFFNQGVDAFRHFTGLKIMDEAALRTAMIQRVYRGEKP